MATNSYKGISSDRVSGSSKVQQVSKFAAALELAENDTTEEFSTVEDFRLNLKKFMSKSKFGLYYEKFMLLISVASTIEFITNTYLEQHAHSDGKADHNSDIASLLFVAFFCCDWCLNFFLADRKMVYILGYVLIICVI